MNRVSQDSVNTNATNVDLEANISASSVPRDIETATKCVLVEPTSRFDQAR